MSSANTRLVMVDAEVVAYLLPIGPSPVCSDDPYLKDAPELNGQAVCIVQLPKPSIRHVCHFHDVLLCRPMKASEH